MEIDRNWAGTTKGREKTLDDSCLFGIGSRVRVAETLPKKMRFFTSRGCVGTVIGRDLVTNFGICDYGYYPIYVLHLDGVGESAWYPESVLSFTDKE